MKGEIIDFPVDITGSSTFGRDPKVISSRTFNMLVTDDWLQDYFGYKMVLQINPSGIGRGIFTSGRSGILLAVISNFVYSILVYKDPITGQLSYNYTQIGQIGSYDGDVFIDENNTTQIAICDQYHLYIYNYVANTFVQAVLPTGVIPGYVTYQDGYFIVVDKISSNWYLSAPGDGTNWFWGAGGLPVAGSLQTKPDLCMAAVRVPGRGNLLYVMGRTTTEFWTDVGSPTFPYQRSYSVNIDYGLLSAATLAISDNVVAWLASNEKSGLAIMYTTGSDIKQISTDGINFKLSALNSPQKSTAFFMKLSGHLVYQLTFYDPNDNYTLFYDFNEGKFYDATDEYMNYHIARRVAFLNNNYHFVSLNDGNLYELSDSFTTFDYGNGNVKEIPRIRVCSNIRMKDQSQFVVRDIGMTIEQGNDTNNDGNNPSYKPRVAMSISMDGGISFSSYADEQIYEVGKRLNKMVWWNAGCTNDYVPQFRFYGKGPWKATNSVAHIYT